MSTTPVNEPSSTQSDFILTEKQGRLQMCLTACHKKPPRFDFKIRPGGKCTFAARFDKTAPGVTFGNVESSSDQITVPAEMDFAAIEVDFEHLTISAGFASVEETKEVWDSIMQLVYPATTAPKERTDTTSIENGLQLPELDDPEESLLSRICMAAHSIQLFAHEAQVRKLESQVERTKNDAQDEKSCRDLFQRLRTTKYNLRNLSSVHNMEAIRALTAWYLHGLFGNVGLHLQNLKRRLVQQRHSRDSVAPKTNSEKDDLSLALIDKLTNTFVNLHDGIETHEEAYEDHLRLYARFYDQLITFWYRCWQKRSAEKKDLIQSSLEHFIIRNSPRNPSKSDMQDLAHDWFLAETGYSRDKVFTVFWMSRHIGTMMRLFGDDVLYFMNGRLESELNEIDCQRIGGDRGVFISTMKAIELMLGEEFRAVCETVREALASNSPTPIEVDRSLSKVREKQSLIAAGPSSESLSKMNTLLLDIKHGRVTLSMDIDDYDELHADVGRPGSKTASANKGGGKKRKDGGLDEDATRKGSEKKRRVRNLKAPRR